MSSLKNYVRFLILLFFLGEISCTEPYAAIDQHYDSLLVVEANITDSLQNHYIKLSRTNPINSYEKNTEKNAQVWIVSNTGEEFDFNENDDGEYVSTVEFALQNDKSYTLHIKTSDGHEYQSDEEKLPEEVIVDVTTTVVNNDSGQKGVDIRAGVIGTDDEPFFVKYEFTEQYKIVTLIDIPYDYSLENLIIDDEPTDDDCTTDFDIVYTERTENSSICYSFPTYSNNIVQGSSVGFNGNSIPELSLHFIQEDEYKLRERCSILVRVYSQNYSAYEYFRKIKELNQNDSELSTQQPGYIHGNIHSVTNSDENVLGLFNVCALAQKRIFFDYTDFGFIQPSYFAQLRLINIAPLSTPCPGPTYKDSIVELRRLNYQLYVPGVLHIFANPACSDCRSYGANVAPDYWEEE
ncbi:protein of unknown function [Pustulibacterium marinum]|uniref:DUF4249 domain-containing protein n=1 Tax=Pustulibacterium marinum TaxID=1224947 RepID=A0A1I7EVV1_9FLAO|nr:DUF4249 domain-containing protein [Pustulibacterium marinum]SFU28053.1 protein of unknown function [Pustulibacterium marinum]